MEDFYYLGNNNFYQFVQDIGIYITVRSPFF